MHSRVPFAGWVVEEARAGSPSVRRSVQRRAASTVVGSQAPAACAGEMDAEDDAEDTAAAERDAAAVAAVAVAAAVVAAVASVVALRIWVADGRRDCAVQLRGQKRRLDCGQDQESSAETGQRVGGAWGCEGESTWDERQEEEGTGEVAAAAGVAAADAEVAAAGAA